MPIIATCSGFIGITVCAKPFLGRVQSLPKVPDFQIFVLQTVSLVSSLCAVLSRRGAGSSFTSELGAMEGSHVIFVVTSKQIASKVKRKLIFSPGDSV